MDQNDMRFRIAAARRILAREGCESQVGGHVSARAPGEESFWVTPFQYFDETLPEHVIKVTFDLKLLEGDWEPSGAIRFHSGLYRARPDVNSVIHIHSFWTSLFATNRRTVGMYNVGAALFYQDQALYEDDGILPRVDAQRMADALGDKRVLLMKNHGAVVVSQSLEQATIEAIMLERSAHFHIEAEKIGGTEFPESEVLAGRDLYYKHFVPQMWEANFRRLERSDPDLWARLSR